MTSQRPIVDFRTPQHPSSGTNNWGGASPLLARNIPKESLEQRYEKLYAIRDYDQIYPPTTLEEEIFGSPQQQISTVGDEIFSSANGEGFRRRGLLWKLRRWQYGNRKGKKKNRNNAVTLGGKMRLRWLPKLDYENKWPNGWC